MKGATDWVRSIHINKLSKNETLANDLHKSIKKLINQRQSIFGVHIFLICNWLKNTATGFLSGANNIYNEYPWVISLPRRRGKTIEKTFKSTLKSDRKLGELYVA